MTWADDITAVLRDRDHWTFAGEVATYQPVPDSWAATVRKPAIPARPAHRWTVSGVRADGTAVWSTWATSAPEAVRVAERWIHAQAGR